MVIRKQHLLRLSIAFVYLLFGGLKLFPNYSPAEGIAIETIGKLTFYCFSESFCFYALSILEVGIGVLLLTKRFVKVAVILAISHLLVTFTPFLFFPNEVFNLDINSLNLLGQYIIKNIIIICALLMIYPSEKQLSQLKTSFK